MGERERFEQFFLDHYPALRRYAARRFGVEHAEDIAQETMLRAFDHFDEIDGGRPAERWLATIARRVGIDAARKRRSVSVDVDVLDDLAPGVPDESVAVATRVDVGHLLRGAMERLSARDREVITLHEVCGVEVRDIAARTGTSQNTIRQRLFRARHNLQRHYRELGGGEYATLPIGSRPAAARPFDSVVQAANRFAGQVQQHLPTERVAELAAVVAVTATIVAGPGGAPRVRPPVDPRKPPVTSPVLLDPAPVGEVVRTGTDLVRRLVPLAPLGRYGNPARLPYLENFDRGLTGWAVTGRSAAPDCLPGNQAGSLCSIRLDPDGRVELQRTFARPLPAAVRVLYAMRAEQGFGRFEVAFDRGVAHVTIDASTRYLTVSAAGVSQQDSVLLVDAPWYYVAVTVDPDRRTVSAQQYISTANQPFAVATVELAARPARVTGLNLAAWGAGPVWYDELSIATANPQCSDGVDNDGDEKVDADDPGCLSAIDDGESPDPQCSDGVDNDGDGRTDLDDPTCVFAYQGSEAAGCSDGVDNDGDGAADYPDDPSCDGVADGSEAAGCRNGDDDDRDGTPDTADLGCTGPHDETEWGCLLVRADTQGRTTYVPEIPRYEIGDPKAAGGVCLDPIARYGNPLLLVADAPGPEVRGYLDVYRYAGTEFPCVRPTVDGAGPDGCAAFGATFVRRLGSLVRANAEPRPGGAAGNLAYLCTASVRVVVNKSDQEPLGRGEHVVTVC